MYSYTNKINNKEADAYAILICSTFHKNMKSIEKKLSVTFPEKLLHYFNDEKKKISKHFVDDKLFLIAKVNEKKCSRGDLDDKIGDLCTLIKGDKKINKVVFVLAPIKDFIRYQTIRTVHHMYDYKNKKKFNIIFCAVPKLKPLIMQSVKEGAIINKMRTMVNQPANIMTTNAFLKTVKSFKQKNLSLEVFDKKKLKKDNFNLILGVNQGSEQEPYLLISKWMPKKNQNPIVIIGKGVMFDTGGINLKYGDFTDMKTDMTGAASAWALMKLCAINNLQHNVVALMPIVENMIGSKAQRPGDVVKSYSGKTVEITNTDAEGRLIMADTLAYSEKFKPKMIIDIATLTGQAGSIFNNLAIIAMSNHKPLITKYEKACIAVNEKMWEMPLWKEYRKYLDSEVADIQNAALKASSGTITAAMFLKEFVPKNTKWLHLDIAGVAFNKGRATGNSMLSIYELLKKEH